MLWVILGNIFLFVTTLEIGVRYYLITPRGHRGGFIKMVVPGLIGHFFELFIVYSLMGPVSILTSIRVSKAIALYINYVGKDVYSTKFGQGIPHQIQLPSVYQKEPSLWVKFHSHKEPKLVKYTNIQFTNINYNEDN